MKLSDLITTYHSRLLSRYVARLLPSHHKALGAMSICRTRHSPKMWAACDDCKHDHFIPHSCGHRSCPHCQAHESQQWLERQLKKRVPAEYFMVTFTLPAQFRSLIWRHQKALYNLIIQSAWETLRTFSLNDKQMHGIPGAIAVLHTHSRELSFHPHVHVVLPAAAIEPGSRLWRSRVAVLKGGVGKKSYLFCHKALAKVFRAKILDGIRKLGLSFPKKYPEEWVVHVKSVGSGEKALVYLGRYLYRGVIQEKDIIRSEKGLVTYRYQESKTGENRYKTVPGEEFLWLILQHVLPKGFRRARNFGFLHPNSKRLIQVIQLQFNIDPNRGIAWLREKPKMICPCCGGVMKMMKTWIRPVFRFASQAPT